MKKKPLWKVYDCIQCGLEVRRDKGVHPADAYCDDCIPIPSPCIPIPSPCHEYYMIERKDANTRQLWSFKGGKKYYSLTEAKQKVYILRKRWKGFYEFRISIINQKILEY